jgi:hypothetical protein
MKKLKLSQKSIGCGYMVQNYEAIYTKDVKEAVLKFLYILNQLDKQYNIPNELFDEYYNVFGDFEDEE